MIAVRMVPGEMFTRSSISGPEHNGWAMRPTGIPMSRMCPMIPLVKGRAAKWG